MATIHLIIDTNAFIQLRDLQDIPWRRVYSEAAQIDLIVIPSVIKELEDFKTGTNDRRRNRARAALKLIDDAMEQDDLALVLRTTRPVVRLVVQRPMPLDWIQFPHLRSSKTDDQIVAAAAASIERAVIFSHDRGPRITGRSMGVEVLKPEEDWHLPPEKSDNDRKLEQLEKQLRERHPVVHLRAGSDTDDPVVVRLPVLPPLPPEEVKRRVGIVLEHSPRAQFSGSGYLDILGPSASDIAEYGYAYDTFVKRVESYFRQLHRAFAFRARVIRIPFSIANESGMSAQALRLQVAVDDQNLLIGDWQGAQRLVQKQMPFPKQPRRPSSRMDLPVDINRSLLRSLGDRTALVDRDPTAFDWIDDPEDGALQGAFFCQDFRARRSVDDAVLVAVTNTTDYAGVLDFELSATNMSQPVKKTICFKLEEREAGWDDPVVKEVFKHYRPQDDEDDD